MSSPQLDIFEALARRDAGIERVIEASDATYRNKLLAAIQILASRGDQFCADDARTIAGEPPPGQHPNLAGAVFNHAARAGLIKTVGFTRSARKQGHANTIRLYRGAA